MDTTVYRTYTGIIMATNSSRYNADSAVKMILLPDGNLSDFEPESDEEIEIEQDPDYDSISDINAGPLEVEIEQGFPN